MAAAHSQTDVLSRVRREQRTHGKPSSFSGLRIVIAATAITLGILLFAFGAIGMLMMARSPQEPIASKLDPAPYVAPQQAEVEPALPQAEPEPTPKLEPESKAVKTFRVIAPPSPPAPVKNETAAQPVPAAEPETTATIPNPPAQAQPQQVQRRQVPQQQQVVRRPTQKQNDSQADNPLFLLFGIKQYR